jgi:hypothetical protein
MIRRFLNIIIDERREKKKENNKTNEFLMETRWHMIYAL